MRCRCWEYSDSVCRKPSNKRFKMNIVPMCNVNDGVNTYSLDTRVERVMGGQG